MSAVQQFVEWVCLAGLAAVGAFALLRLVWRHRLDNAAIAALAAALAVVAVPKDRGASGRGGIAPPPGAVSPRSGTGAAGALPFYVPVVYAHWLSGIFCTTNGEMEVEASRESWACGGPTNLTLLASPSLTDRAAWAPFATLVFPAGATAATNTVPIPAFPSSPHSAFFALSDGADSDGDGIADWREAMAYGTNPLLADTDGDGVSDAEELVRGTNPLEHGDSPVQTPYEAASTNMPWNVRGWILAPGAFALDGVAAGSNLFERTIVVERTSPWQQLFVSSRPDGPGGWSACDLTVELRLDGPEYMDFDTVHPGDGVRVNIGTNDVDTVTLALRATGPSPRLDRPLYLLRWTAGIVLDASNTAARASALLDGGVKRAFAARRAESGRFELPFTFDFSTLPAHGISGSSFPSDHDMDFQLRLPPNPSLRVEHLESVGGLPDIFGPMLFVADEPSTAQLPPAGTNGPARVFFYELDVKWPDPVEAGPRASQFDAPYPLDSTFLRTAFHDAGEAAPPLRVVVTMLPQDQDALLGAGIGVPGSSLLPSVEVSAPGLAVPHFCGIPDWDGRFALTNAPPERFPAQAGAGDDALAAEAPGGGDDCGCSSTEDGPSLSPFRMRVSLGEPGAGRVSGFLWTALDGTEPVAPSSFCLLAASQVSSTTNESGFTVSCEAAGGRTLLVTNIANGAAVAVFNASGREECRWETWNPGGDASKIRVRRVTAAGNATLDEMYNLDAPLVASDRAMGSIRGVVPDSAESRSNLLTGAWTVVSRWRRDAGDPGFVTEEADDAYGPDGERVLHMERSFSRIGEGDAAVRRESWREGNDMESGMTWERREYVCDGANRLRHGLLRSVERRDGQWTIYDYDGLGREVVRMDRLFDSQFPYEVEVPSLWSDLSGRSAARITLTSYDPAEGDSAHPNDRDLPRRRDVYVRQRQGGAYFMHFPLLDPVLVSTETWVYSREEDAAGVPLRRCARTEGLGDAVRADETLAYPDDAAVPPHLRGLVVCSTDADGASTTNEYSLSGGLLTTTTRRRGPSSSASQPIQHPTYSVSVTDAAHRLPLREETRLTVDDALLEWSEWTYDDIRRLRSATYSDGTWETNAYSCCRLLWSRGRDGRRRLRSARTGSDMLYNADEEVWMLDVLGSPLSRSWGEAFRVTRHFYDAFGRETNTTACVSCDPGASADPPGPDGDAGDVIETVSYPDGSSCCRETVDRRGRFERRYESQDEWSRVAGKAGEDLLGPSMLWINGYRQGDEGFREQDWGQEIEYVERWRQTEWTGAGLRRVIDGSDVPRHDTGGTETFTNTATFYDALGRAAVVVTPLGVTSNFYDGASSRVLRAVTASSSAGRAFMSGADVAREVEYLYDGLGERVGSVQDGVTNRTDVAYAFDDGAYWRVTTRSVAGPSTNSVTTTREQLTGLSNALRSRTITVSADGVATTNVVSYDSETMVETSTTSSPAFGTRVARGVCGLVLEEETADETTAHIYDPHGREVRTDRRASGEADFRNAAEFVYNAMGDLVERRTYTNETDYVAERFAYDHEGREVASTNALGDVVATAYDPRGNVIAVDGATYPLRMSYDAQGCRMSLNTTRDGEIWDETRWPYDRATGLCTSKTYADNSTVSYTYTSDGKPLRTTYASGRWRENSYNAKRELASVEYSDGEASSFAYDEFANEIAASNNAASVAIMRDGHGRATNETMAVMAGGSSSCSTVVRRFDACGRLAESDGSAYAYAADGQVASISNAIAVVEYLYTADRLDAGYALTLSNGLVFTRSLIRDAYRRSLVTDITNSVNGIDVETFSYAYDALGRPTARNADTFGYNDRSEVTSATIGGNYETHEYDSIGNSIIASFNGATNTYSANNLNQYTSILRTSAPPREPAYDIDGNMHSDGALSFTYDAANRLKTVSTNGVQILANFYDAKSRRVKKVTAEATTIFFYDAWNLIEERVACTNGTTSTIRYYWGKDLSGGLQGAGGVGGLLYLTVNGTIYIPCYDSNGNITRYLDANGNTVAQYTYDAFGNTISKSGPLADSFRHRFSTKYFDAETGLYYYGYRFYHPILMRWLNRDPIDESGGENLYCFCDGRTMWSLDSLGLFSWEVLPRQMMYDLGYLDRFNPPYDYITGWPQIRPDASTLATTGFIWDIGVKCKCESDLWVVDDAAGFVVPVIHMRRDRFTERAKTRIIALENDHIADNLKWIESHGKKLVEDYLNKARRNVYTRKILCESKNSTKLFKEFSDGLAVSIGISMSKWDMPHNGQNAKHSIRVERNKKGIYDLVE